jgi:3-dehydroquinate dehydratase
LFDVNVPAVSKHMRNILKSEELIEKSVVSKMEITASYGEIYQTYWARVNGDRQDNYR